MRQPEIVEIDGQEYPIYFGMNALAQFCRDEEVAMKDIFNLGEEIEEDPTAIDKIIKLCFYGFKDGHRKARKESEFPFDQDDIGDFLDDDWTILERVMELFAESLPQEKSDKSPGKRKAAAKK